MTVVQAKEVIHRNRCRIESDTAAGDTRHLDAPSPVRRFGAYLLLSVDILAIFSIFMLVLNVDLRSIELIKLITAIGFSVIAAGVIGGLAHSTGSSVWQWRVTKPTGPATPNSTVAPTGSTDDMEATAGSDDTEQGTAGSEFPPRRSFLVAKVLGLAVVSILSGFGIFVRVVQEASQINMHLMGWVIGAVVGIAAILAPWLVVIDEMRSGSIEMRTVEALTKMVQDTEDKANSLLDAAGANNDKASALSVAAESAQQRFDGTVGTARARAEKMIYKARSLHTSSGRYAIDEYEVAGPTGGRDALDHIFAVDTSPIDKAIERLRSPG